MTKDISVRENKKLAQEIDDLFSESMVKIGVLGKFDERKRSSDDGSSGVTVGQVAIIHEFGTSTIPERSFLRSTWREEEKKLFDTLRKILKGMKGNAGNKQKMALEKLGNYMVGRVKKKFTNNDWPDLEDPTRGGKNKGGNATPLVDTGQLRASITYEVIDER